MAEGRGETLSQIAQFPNFDILRLFIELRRFRLGFVLYALFVGFENAHIDERPFIRGAELAFRSSKMLPTGQLKRAALLKVDFRCLFRSAKAAPSQGWPS